MKRVTGIEYNAVRLLMILNIWWAGTRAYRNPFTSMRSLSTLLRNFKKMMGAPKLARAYKLNGKYVWDIYNPAWPSKAFNLHFLKRLHEIRSISTEYNSLRRLVIAITKRCPLQCEHCSEGDTLYQPDILGYEALRDRIASFVNRGTGQLVYSGGEPLSRFNDLVKLIKHFNKGCDQWIYTSGFGLDPEKAKALKQAGLNGVAISLDHHTEDGHNAFRGNNKSYYWVLQSIKNCREAGLMAILNVCPTNEYIASGGMEEYMRHARELGIPIINIYEPRSVGHYKGKSAELQPAHKEILEGLCDKYNFSKTLSDFPSLIYPASFRKTTPCGGGRSYLFLDYDGKLYPCPFCRVPVNDIDPSKNLCLA